jgi:hypothetical protein
MKKIDKSIDAYAEIQDYDLPFLPARIRRMSKRRRKIAAPYWIMREVFRTLYNTEVTK